MSFMLAASKPCARNTCAGAFDDLAPLGALPHRLRWPLAATRVACSIIFMSFSALSAGSMPSSGRNLTEFLRSGIYIDRTVRSILTAPQSRIINDRTVRSMTLWLQEWETTDVSQADRPDGMTDRPSHRSLPGRSRKQGRTSADAAEAAPDRPCRMLRQRPVPAPRRRPPRRMRRPCPQQPARDRTPPLKRARKLAARRPCSARRRRRGAGSATTGGRSAASSVSTDDAYVRAYNTTLAAKVAGYVASVRGRPTTRWVHAGDVIATHRRRRLSARGRFRARARSRPSRRPSPASASRSRPSRPRSSRPRRSLSRRKPAATRTELELERQQRAGARKEFASRQTLEQAQANRDQAAAARAGRAGRDRCRATPMSRCSRAQQQEAIAHARGAEDRARQGRARSVVHRHPRADRRRDRQPRHAGRRLRADRASGSRAWCRSTTSTSTPTSRRRSSRGCGPASRSTIAVDALPEHDIEGTVESVSPASGAVFSLLPPDNATGNFTKIVQRLPVRIQRAGRRRRRGPAAPRHVGGGQRQHQEAAALADSGARRARRRAPSALTAQRELTS